MRHELSHVASDGDGRVDGQWARAIAGFCVRHAGIVLIAWFGIVGLLNVFIPQLERVVETDSTSLVPSDAPAVVGLERMDQKFGNGKSSSFIVVVVHRKGGLTNVDRQFVLALAPRLARDTEHVSFVQDLEQAEVRDALTSDDGEAMYLPVGIPGATGSPAATDQIDAVRAAVQVERPSGLAVNVTGPPTSVRDMTHEVETSMLLVTVAVLAMISVILLVLYRSMLVTVLILGTIGIALGVSRALVAFCGLHVFGISTFTGSLMTAIVLGAGTDYAVFLVSRYFELRRTGLDAESAAQEAGAKVSGIVVGSALTVAVANGAMYIADVAFFNTTGPAVSVAVLATLLIAVTVIPAVLALAGRRGWLEARPQRGVQAWGRLAGLVVTRPTPMLMAVVVLLLSFGAFYPSMDVNYDQAATVPDHADSSVGLKALDEHFPINEVLPTYAVISSNRDLRNSEDLAAIDQAADEVARTHGIKSVRSLTRPDGNPIVEASLGYQAGKLGGELGDAASEVSGGAKDAQKLADGAKQVDTGMQQLDGGIGELADGAGKAADGAGLLLNGMTGLADGLGKLEGGARAARQGSGKLSTGARQLADGLELGYTQLEVAVRGLEVAYETLATHDMTCRLDTKCKATLDNIKTTCDAFRSQLLPGLNQAVEGARRIADGTAELSGGMAQLQGGLAQARAGANRIAAGQKQFVGKLGEMADGVKEMSDGSSQLATGTSKVSNGTQQVVGKIEELGDGMNDAADYLDELGATARDPAASGFYVPLKAFDDDRMTAATTLYLSKDTHATRLVIFDAQNANSRAASQRIPEIEAAIKRGLRGTDLADAKMELTGPAIFNENLDDLSQADFAKVASAALLAVFVILAVMLRSLAAPLFLLVSVALSYVASMGLSVAIWQHWLDLPLDWAIPPFAFVLLVAVGADYNLLLMKRMKEEAPDGSAAGIGRALVLAGGVITAAGMIFAASMFAMMAGSIVTVAQMGFTVGTGLIIDTCIVRTVLVPAAASLLGPKMWWPTRARAEARTPARPPAPKAAVK